MIGQHFIDSNAAFFAKRPKNGNNINYCHGIVTIVNAAPIFYIDDDVTLIL